MVWKPYTGLPIATYILSQAFHYVFCFINTEHIRIIQEKVHKQNHKKTEWQQKKLILYLPTFTDMSANEDCTQQ